MKYWNGYSWRDSVTTPISLESIEHATLTAIGMDQNHPINKTLRGAYEQKLSGVTIQRINVEGDDPDKFIHDLEQTMLSHAPGVQYDDEDHGKGLPNE